MLQPDTRKWRENTLGIDRRRHGFLRQPDGQPTPALNAFTKYFLPDEPGYPDWVHTTGFWFLPSALEDYEPPGYVMDFLRAGDTPVYIGFGSMVSVDPAETGRIVAQAVRLAGVRAVVGRGWGGVGDVPPTDDICYVDDVPFSWLFPRMSAIVHHGGAGVTGTALAAGRPQVVCPFVFEQYFYADRLHARGIATRPLPRRKLSATKLAEAIDQAVTDRALMDRS